MGVEPQCWIACAVCGGVLDTEYKDAVLASPSVGIQIRSDIEFWDHLDPNEMECSETKASSDDGNLFSADLFTYGRMYSTRLLTEADIEWLKHFKAFGKAKDDEYADQPLWSSEVPNESVEPDIYLSPEARIEDTRRGENILVVLPRNDETISGQPNIRRVYPRNLNEYPFTQPVAHTNCLRLFEHFARCKRVDLSRRTNVPLNMRELIEALSLRRVYYSDSCHTCIPGWTARTPKWSHEFFGLTGLADPDSPWITIAGSEMFCADPISTIALDDFKTSYTTASHPPGAKPGLRTSSEPSNCFLDLPFELLGHICSLLSLRSIRALKNVCHTSRRYLNDCSPVWRHRCIDLHGDWFWELKDPSWFPVRTTAWAEVLWQLEIARSDILDAAGSRKYMYFKEERQDRIFYDKLIYRPMLFDLEGRRKLPLGLQNRLRIWCCLEGVGNDGTQIALQGQRKGLDPPGIEWDGASRHAECPSCGHSTAFSFNRLKILAGRTDLT